MIEIVSHRDKSKVLYRAETARDVREAVEEALREGTNLQNANLQNANLRGAKLWGAKLWGAKLWGADLREANLRGANLGGADLREADLRGADLREANLRGANLGEADLRGADLREADLRGADLGGADLWGADLRSADLRGADLRGAKLWGAKGAPLMLTGLPSGPALVHLSNDGGWRITIGCWTGTPDELETLIAGDEWPEADGVEQEKRRPALTALVALARAHIAYTEAAGEEAGNE